MKLYKNLVKASSEVLGEIFEKKVYCDRALEKKFKENKQWGSRDRRFVAESVYDIVRNYRLYCEIAKTENNFWILISIWLVLKDFPLPDWPEFKNVDSRKILKTKDFFKNNFPIYESYPDWLCELASRELGEEIWKIQARALNNPAHVILRCNNLKVKKEDLKKLLQVEGIETIEIENCIDGLKLLKRQNIFKSKLFQEGFFEVQDKSSQEVAYFLNPRPGETVIDACAGAGGKSLHLSALMKNKGKIICLDVEEAKLAELKKRARRAGAFNIENRTFENNSIKKLTGRSDKLLLDVPCSGTGVIKRNPDTKWKLNLENLEKVKQVQRKILDDYNIMLKQFGILVYSTCSILPSENQNQVREFLNRNKNFELLEEKTILPNEGYDGFYMAKIKKTS